MLKVIYAVVTRAGDFKRRGNGNVIVRVKKAAAIKQATADGDAVVELTWDTDKEPVHIRHRVLPEEEQ